MDSVLEVVFAQVARNSLAGGILVLLLWLGGLFWRRSLPPIWGAALCVVVLVRMVLPTVPGWDWNISFRQASVSQSVRVPEPGSTVPRIEARLVVGETTAGSFIEPALLERGAFSSFGAISPKPPGRVLGAKIDVMAWLASVWLVGVVVLIAMAISSHFIFLHQLDRRTTEPTARLLDLLSSCGSQVGVRCLPSLHLVSGLGSPMLVGAIRPRLLIPASWARESSDEEVRAVFLHELAHLKRGDLWWNTGAFLVAALHWFNPAVWWLVRRFRADREVLCDLAAARLTGNPSGYAGVLLGLFERRCGLPKFLPKSLPATAAIFSPPSEIKHRIIMVKTPTSPKWYLVAALAVLFPVCSGLTLTQAFADDRESPRSRGGDAETPREGRAPAPEEGDRSVRREGDSRSGREEVRRDGDNPGRVHPEREVRRDGEGPRPEQRDGQSRPPAESREVRPASPEARLDHLMAAAENLERAGLVDEARRYREQAERMRHEIHRAREHAGGAERAERLELEVRELHEIVRALQEEIRVLRSELERRDR